MKTIEECVVMAMDGSDARLYPYLPYILQDLWAIGANPDKIIHLTGKNFENTRHLKVLDLGCGKGAVSIKIANKIGCKCYGIDAIPEFIDFARNKAAEYQVDHLCTFEVGDIREKVIDLSGYDVIILGAIGPVFGDYFTTLTSLSECINKNGIIIIDDGYIEGNRKFTHPLMLKKSDMLQQIAKAGFELAEECIIPAEDILEEDKNIFDHLLKRCYELVEQYPEKRNLFHDYIKKQEFENHVLENEVICSTMVIKRSFHE